MLMRKSLFASTVFATAAALVLTSAGPSFAASSTPASKGISKGISASGSSHMTDFSSQRRYHHRGRGGGAAAAAAFAGIVGTIGAIAASRNAEAYDYYDGPAYYSGGPVYYGDQRYTSPYGGGSYGYGGGTYLDPGGNIIPYQ
ncbi:MAG: hypothetical protein JSS22_12975 [Proteobacteria bacterium]|nr:hypothetical protein [Pseudomonadota bacterium]